MSIPGPSLPCRVEWGIMLSSFPRLPQPQEEQIRRYKNLQRPPLLHKKNVPASRGMDGSPEAPITWLQRPFSGPPQPEAGLSGLTGHSASRLKLPEGGLPRPYGDPKKLFLRPCESRGLNSHGRETGGFYKWMNGYNPRPLCDGQNKKQGHLLQFNQKSPLVKPTHKCEVKVPKTQESMMTSEDSSMLSEITIDVGPENKGFFTYPWLNPKKNG